MIEVAIETMGACNTQSSPATLDLNITSEVRALVLLHSQVDDMDGAKCTADWNGDEDFVELLDYQTTWGRADVYIMYLNDPTPGDYDVRISRTEAGRGHVVVWALTDCGAFPDAMVDFATAEANPGTSVNASGLSGPAGSMALGGGACNIAGENTPVGDCTEDVDVAAVDGRFWAGHDLNGDNIGFSGASCARGCAAIMVESDDVRNMDDFSASLAGMAGRPIIVNAAEDGFELAGNDKVVVVRSLVMIDTGEE